MKNTFSMKNIFLISKKWYELGRLKTCLRHGVLERVVNELDIDLLNQRNLLSNNSAVELRFGSTFEQMSIVNFWQIYRSPAHGGMIKHENCFGVFHIDSLSVQNLNFKLGQDPDRIYPSSKPSRKDSGG